MLERYGRSKVDVSYSSELAYTSLIPALVGEVLADELVRRDVAPLIFIGHIYIIEHEDKILAIGWIQQIFTRYH